jgi:hypothetical protein
MGKQDKCGKTDNLDKCGKEDISGNLHGCSLPSGVKYQAYGKNIILNKCKK